jgi:hypothetical protein
MILRCPSGRFLCKAIFAWLGVAVAAGAVHAETAVKFAAHYIITMTHVTVGEMSWSTNFSGTSYLASATGKASGVLSVLVKGEGTLTTRGAFEDGKLTPAVARFDVSDDDGVYDLEMTFDDGVFKRVVDRGAPPPEDRVPVGPKLLHDVIDPLSAFLIPVEGKALTPANCGKVLKIFDGRRRYDLALSFKRMDAVKLARGYSGPVLVCGVVLHPIAGYRPGSLLVRYLAGKDDLELWLAPIAGASIIAPVRALMPTLVGTMDISADEFVERKLEVAPKAVDVAPVAPAKPVEAAPLAPTQPVETAPLDPPKPQMMQNGE